MGLELIQGYYYGRPVPADEFEKQFFDIGSVKAAGKYEDKKIRYFPAACFCAYIDRFFRLKCTIAIR